jgi:enoyl-CoA hydratase/carnithine racemase
MFGAGASACPAKTERNTGERALQTLPQLAESLLDIDGRVATLTLNRDDVRNELTGSKLVDDVVATVDWINANEEISALVLTGGGRAFSSGGNVKHMRDRSGAFAGDVYHQQNYYRNGVQRSAPALDRLEVPSIAAINGAAIGAGLDLSMMCDIRIASADAILGETFVNLGLIPGDGGLWFLTRIVGCQRAAELAFSGRVIKAEEAKELGLVLEVAPHELLLGRAQEMARHFASKPPRAVRMTKRLLKSAGRLGLGDFLDHCANFQGMAQRSDDHIEAISAFLDKREAAFSGR